MDTQECQIDISSFGFAFSEIRYSWTPGKTPVKVEQTGLSDYILVSFMTGETNQTSKKPGLRSVIFARFKFQRMIGYYALRTYFPLGIIVASSWVSFWLVRTEKGSEITARTALGVTCCLAVVTIGFVGNTKPKVSYATALDVYIIFCFVLVFLALIEFAFIHFVELFMRRVKYKDQDRVLHLQEMTNTLIIPVFSDFNIDAKMPGTGPPKEKSDRYWPCTRRELDVAAVKEEEHTVEDGGQKDGNSMRSIVIERGGYITDVIMKPGEVYSDSNSDADVMETESLVSQKAFCSCKIHHPESKESIEWVDVDNDSDWVDISESVYSTEAAKFSLTSYLLDYLVDLVSRTRVGFLLEQTELYYDTTNAVQRYDANCRFIFPLAYVILNTLYFSMYLYIL